MLMWRSDDRLDVVHPHVVRPLGLSPFGQRVKFTSADQAASLLSSFWRAETRPLRRMLAGISGTIEVSRLTDREVIAQLARALVSERLHAYRYRDSPSMRIPDPLEELAPTVAPAKQLTWVEIRLVDDDGHAVPNERYILHLPDGTELPGRLDEKGRAFVDQIPSGQCKVCFPDLDATEWQAV